ncbi:MAG: hypothetical protein A3F82_01470 [Deltaproteobacteria bacterium RIFCSPLOWO2_12_FULL_44_12]|nr:MAG: hypothetical protein A2712_03490 [Deltaproteobacteria bacterium RIFCSPHIGHO2_01_FULL_43_49]OGQ16255.1 MAG: hypothetical protein A3D22_01460 [Deltaproteobacteria bacterium RIFCSPHIGHO2_02_FULL_44_53]OGQ29215.1 MAG: hypothetical protein A3D98_05245 [Deltaproteobacteria bacterium RIFCSPHIGHO2_12_FULL_44_21]OGQ32772.1 MAG: hypothetical protein A2979_09390 [Deltaproteobacteria bacterium RIFCSPLOWO2_01_FULL_45_74]OGQ41874.1 MAG: hypothetical protein A3I70_09175 [Deltaproteobacteria bacterium 
MAITNPLTLFPTETRYRPNLASGSDFESAAPARSIPPKKGFGFNCRSWCFSSVNPQLRKPRSFFRRHTNSLLRKCTFKINPFTIWDIDKKWVGGPECLLWGLVRGPHRNTEGQALPIFYKG